MNIEQAIKHFEEVAYKLEDYVNSGCCCDDTEVEDEHFKCADEHRQLAEWLKELKHLRNITEYAKDFDCTVNQAIKDLTVEKEVEE